MRPSAAPSSDSVRQVEYRLLHVESDTACWKRTIGDGLRFQTDGRQSTGVAVAVNALNRMLDLRRPNYVRIA